MHLRPKQYYIDRYDRLTVEHFRTVEKTFLADMDFPPLEGKKLSEKEANAVKWLFMKQRIYFEVGEWYLDKEETIQKWMKSDREKDRLLDSAQVPEQIRCLTCQRLMESTFQELWSELDKEDRVLLMYDCPNKCLPRRAFFSDGEEWRVKPDCCPRCASILDQKFTRTDEKAITEYTCPKCEYSKTDEHLWAPKPDEILDKDFAKDRDRFCLTEEAGKVYQREKWNLERTAILMEEWKKRDEARAEKLKENPDGFHLEDKGYTCQICRRSVSDKDTWYDKYGLTCLLCKNARRNGIIPDYILQDKALWYSVSDLEHYFSVKGQTVRKLFRNGKLKGRVIPTEDGSEYFLLFLVEDNKGFLPLKPKSYDEKIDSPFISSME